MVILMQENRSFDHYYGALAGVRGFADKQALAYPDGTTIFEQPDPKRANKTLLPFRMDTTQYDAQEAGDLDHSWGGTHAAWNGGAWNRWVTVKGEETMGHFTRADIPWIVAPYRYSEHPQARPVDGAAYTEGVLQALWANPELWESTVVLIDFDENDGFFDHMPPPSPAANTAGEFVAGLPVGLGPRVPRAGPGGGIAQAPHPSLPGKCQYQHRHGYGRRHSYVSGRDHVDVDWATADGWYEVTVTANTATPTTYRFAGRIERT